MDTAERTRRVASVLWLTLALNWSSAALKIALGLYTQSMAITADGFHSLSDGTSNIIGLVGILISGHPADHDHPYGHEKYETFASILIGAILLGVAFSIFRRAIGGFFDPGTPEAPDLSFWIMGVTFLVNLFVVWYERKKAKELGSELLLNDSWHTMTDVFVTLGVFAAMLGIRFHAPWLDPLFSVGIAGVIATVAVRILKQSSDVLCDRAVLDASEVERIVRGVEGVVDCHEIRSRGRSQGVYLDLHVMVDPAMSVAASHRVANLIEKDLKRALSGVRDVVVHIEPTTHDHHELETDDGR